MSHPSLGLPPRSLVAGYPEAAARLREQRARIATRALEGAVAEDPTFADRHDDAGLRNLLRDAEVLTERLAQCVAGDDPFWLKEFANQAAPVFRRRKVPMDDVVRICEGLRSGARGVLAEDEMIPAERALGEAIDVFRWYRRLAGDARKRNRLVAAIYKGA